MTDSNLDKNVPGIERINCILIAACGMNCALCRAYLREKNPCIGCRYISIDAQKTILNCKMRTCVKRKGEFCYDCLEYPCDRLKHMDQRYRGKYNMSEIENLEYIRDQGMEKFLEQQRENWQSPQGILCVHDKKLY